MRGVGDKYDENDERVAVINVCVCACFCAYACIAVSTSRASRMCLSVSRSAGTSAFMAACPSANNCVIGHG